MPKTHSPWSTQAVFRYFLKFLFKTSKNILSPPTWNRFECIMVDSWLFVVNNALSCFCLLEKVFFCELFFTGHGHCCFCNKVVFFSSVSDSLSLTFFLFSYPEKKLFLFEHLFAKACCVVSKDYLLFRNVYFIIFIWHNLSDNNEKTLFPSSCSRLSWEEEHFALFSFYIFLESLRTKLNEKEVFFDVAVSNKELDLRKEKKRETWCLFLGTVLIHWHFYVPVGWLKKNKNFSKKLKKRKWKGVSTPHCESESMKL